MQIENRFFLVLIMDNSASITIENQMDNFLEQFKLSASKDIDVEWSKCSSSGTDTGDSHFGSPQRQATQTQRLLQQTKSRSRCLETRELLDNVENGLVESQAVLMTVSQTQMQQRQQQQQYSQHMIESQNSVSSGASTQTVFFQSVTSSPAYASLESGILQHTASTISSNSTNSLNSLGVTYAAEALSAQRSAVQINSLLEYISPAEAVATMSGEGVLNIADVADLLHPQHAIITGGRSQDGCPLIIFPDNNNFNSLEEADYQKLILYLSSVPSLQDADLGFHLIVDRRKDRWTSVKTVLQRISIYFPGIIHVVYVLRPLGLFQKAISEVSSKFSSKDEYRFRLIVCSTLSDLHEFVDNCQLTSDMGGSLIYSHHEWIQQRVSLEKFSSLTHQVSAELDVFIQAIHDTEFPNSVETTKKLLEDQGTDYARLKEEILAAAKHGETLLDKIKAIEELKEFSERTGNISAIERLLVQLEETERRFDEFWRTHCNRLEQCLHLRMFEQDFRELQNIFDGHMKTVAFMTEIGESVNRVVALIEETQEFCLLIESDIQNANKVIQSGQQLIGSRGVYPWEIVQPKCDELERVGKLIRMRLTRRLEILAKNSELMERVEKANQWCANGVELLASQRIEKCSVSEDLAEQSLHEIQAFIASASNFKLSSPSEFKKIFLESTTPETKALVSQISLQVLQRIDDVSLMCDKRIASLKKLALKPPRPVQQVTPEPAVPLQPPGGAPHLLRRKQNKTIIMHELRPRSMDGVIDSVVTLNRDSGLSLESNQHMQSQQDVEAQKLKRGHVLSELLETERIYVNEMSSILKGYCDQMQSDELIHLVPASLQGKEDILFGNLHELFTFHNDIFLKDLENCISTTELVALCFVQRRDTFYRLYSFYCQNIPRSERLRETLVDTHLFLQECQKRLGHKLPLAAYLLKPVQRITKYQLLLKDLLKFSDSGSCTKELQKALDCMLIVLKCVNDSMHQVAITGFPTDLAQLGELLLQDSFQVWTESKKDIRLRIKPQQRHIFLYQKSLLFCKQTPKTSHSKSTYQFKHHLKMSQIGLTETVRGDPKRFEVWLQGRQEVHTLHAPTLEVKIKWVTEIKKVLLNQLEELKGEKIKQYGLNHRGLKQTTSWDTPNIIIGQHSRAINCDSSSESWSRNSNSSDNIGHAACTNSTGGAGIGDRDHPEACSWSSDYSNSEDELSLNEDISTPGGKFIALADYIAMGHSEVSIREGEVIELLKVGCAGWWYVRVLDTNSEGWTPGAYLESINRKYSNTKKE
ncbi:guanine nucleotide exchange factor DBS isoform X3 [Drosophila busckii]|uniref:guanine nucleotide exchange factor DBS isoform X3 n=1 Tax=Drosophila busckii TaxID=30019 RepID=UPI00083F2E5E|nr:guanine nucleotide exchange factor DBS isoform X3 [Drosophila busckii]